jgi:hypothetical protein
MTLLQSQRGLLQNGKTALERSEAELGAVMTKTRSISFVPLLLAAAVAMAEGALAQPAPPAAEESQPPARIPAEPAKPRRLTGAEAWNSLLGNSATGKTSDGMRTDYYGADGTIKTLVDSELKTGKWRLQGERVCIEYPSTNDDDDDEEEGETCYRVTISGNFVVFLDEDGEGWRLRILPGNPKDL